LQPFDSAGEFQPIGRGGQLRRLAVRSAGVTVAFQALAFGVQMASTAVLARLLRPSDFGLVTMVTTFSLLFVSFGINGYSEAIMQRDRLSHFLASNLFWINIGAGVFLTLVFAASGSLLARFYGDARIVAVSVGMSATILVASTSVVPLALLKRAMCFTAVSVNEIVARMVSVAVGIVGALSGWGYWALVAMAIAQPVSQSVGGWILCRWTPAAPRRVEGTGSIVRFAVSVYGRFTLNHFARNMDNLLVGWQFGPAALGFYKKAYDLFVLPANQLLSPVSDVTLSTLSRLDRYSAQYRRYFLNGIGLLAFAGMAASGIMTLVGKDLIRFILGPGWEEAGRIFMFFGPGIGMMLICGTAGFIHLSIGRADRWLRWVVVEFTVTGLLFLLGLRWGPVGIAVAWTASFWILTLPALWYAGKPVGFGIGPMISVIWRYAVGALIAGIAAAPVLARVPTLVGAPGAGGALERIATASCLFGVLYLAAVVAMHGGWEPLHQITRILADVVPWKKSPPPAKMAEDDPMVAPSLQGEG
jgi:PST family polysaccharide transporter